MRILLMSASYAPVLGGLQTVVHTLACHLCRQGHEVQVLTNRYPRSLPEIEVRDGVHIERWLFLIPSLEHFKRARLDLGLASVCYYPHTMSKLTRLFREFQPDVVNLHFPECQIPFILGMRRRFPFRLVVSLHGHEVERLFESSADKRHRSHGVRLRRILREADAVTACSLYLLRQAGKLEPSAMQRGLAIHNGVDIERFTDKTPYQRARPYVLALGRLTRKKGFDILLQAFARVADAAPDTDVVIAGEGEERNNLEAQARDLKIQHRVHFHGKASPRDVVRLLNGAKGLVIPSRSEPFGIVALEALAAGKRVLASRVGGLRELLQEFEKLVGSELPECDGTGPGEGARHGPVHLVEPTTEGFAQGIGFLLSVPSCARQALRCAAHVTQQYSWARLATQYEQVLAGPSHSQVMLT